MCCSAASLVSNCIKTLVSSCFTAHLFKTSGAPAEFNKRARGFAQLAPATLRNWISLSKFTTFRTFPWTHSICLHNFYPAKHRQKLERYFKSSVITLSRHLGVIIIRNGDCVPYYITYRAMNESRRGKKNVSVIDCERSNEPAESGVPVSEIATFTANYFETGWLPCAHKTTRFGK